MINHELGLANGIAQNCKDLLAEVYILAFEDLVLCLQGIWPYVGKLPKNLDRGRLSGVCDVEAYRIYDFLQTSLPEDGSAFTPKIFLERACVRAGISYEEGLKKCQTKPKTN